MTTTSTRSETSSTGALRAALDAADERALQAAAAVAPRDARDRFSTLLTIYALHCAPLETVGGSARWQHHPAVAAIKRRCEDEWLGELETLELHSDLSRGVDATDPVGAMRALAARDRLPLVYKWLARTATWPQIVTFLTLEGGPDAGFDDLVAACQIGLRGSAKLELATNYWDEMGNGRADDVHTTLHDRLVEAIDMPRLGEDDQPVSALARTALGGLLATNRWLQPEMLGALGLIELQAGPRCRLVLQAFDRVGAPAAARPFYEVHADVDPRHGKDWLEKAIMPVLTDHPEWGARIVRGAIWRAAVNAAFLDDVADTLIDTPVSSIAAA